MTNKWNQTINISASSENPLPPNDFNHHMDMLINMAVRSGVTLEHIVGRLSMTERKIVAESFR